MLEIIFCIVYKKYVKEQQKIWNHNFVYEKFSTFSAYKNIRKNKYRENSHKRFDVWKHFLRTHETV